MKIIVTGASSQIGYYLLPNLLVNGHECYALSRSEHSENNGITWIQGDLHHDDNFFERLKPVDAWIHLGPLYLVDAWLEEMDTAGIKRFIGFSTTSIFTKQNSSNIKESEFISSIKNSEQAIQHFCESRQINWTLLRPTLIYGCGKDLNIAFIEKMIARFGFFPIVGAGSGLRQPVHAEDLALACSHALTASEANNKAYNLSGGETLSYRVMVEKVFQLQNRSTRILSVPAFILKFIVVLLACLPKFRHLTPAMVDRMNQDMVFDHSEAKLELSFQPRAFMQKSE